MPAKVAITRCADYRIDELHSSITKALELIGGIDGVEGGERKVLLKPNLLSARPPESGVNTHPEFVRAVIRILKDIGITPMIGDSHGGSPGREQSQDEVYRATGIADVALEEGAQLIKFDKIGRVNGIAIAQAVMDADLVINLPKFKTHSLMKFTGAVKNCFGTVPGVRKTEYHKEFPKPERFSKILVDVFSIVRPSLSIMDAVAVMEGDGPAAGTLRNAGYVMASRDAVALDAVCAFMMGIEPLAVATTSEAYTRGLGEADLGKIEILGEMRDSLVMKGFRLPKSTLLDTAPSFMLKLATNLLKFRVVIDEDICAKCKICQRSCPVQAITINDKLSRIDQSRCIKCMCCHEVCPYNAVFIRRNIFMKLLNM